VKPRGADTRQNVEGLYDRYADELHRYALMLLADYDAAKDVVQQVFVKLLNKSRSTVSIERPAPYLRRAVRNECYRICSQRLTDQRKTAAAANKAMLGG